jgi:hypothetical protein
MLGWLSAAVLAWGTGLRADEPPDVTGTWTWTWKDPQGETHRHVLEVEGVGTKLAAVERFDDLSPVKVSELKLAGKNIAFTVVRGAKRAEYKGVVADANPDTMSGKVTITTENQPTEFLWNAKRVKPAEIEK